ncbi:MAG: formate dehydrogenase accessory sulfurtransferase FdhD [Candidatus Margulisbacteria bacterium]|nr:formate dehydrogenase accessory sulfurtransferase FdhD [Candidatus Margulisiibacteriota bacterium]
MKEPVKITKYREGKPEEIDDVAAVEVPLTIVLNEEQLITLLCSPDKMDFLAIGFLLSEGFISSKEDIESILLDKKITTVRIKIKDIKKVEIETIFGRRIITSGCGKGMTFFDYKDFSQCRNNESQIKISADKILSLINEFQKKSELFKETGGVHSAALSDGEKILLFAEDLGRHNALDKIFGEALWEGVGLRDRLLLTSGRLTSEIVIKALKRDVPIIVSPSAPTDLAIRIAQEMGMTLVGFARGKRMNVYSAKDRIM